MSVTVPAILNGTIRLTANPVTLSPLQTSLPVNLPLMFSSVANLKIITGSYTPNDDTAVIASGLSAVSPNFILFMCDGLANLKSDNNMLGKLPINKVGLITLAPIVGGASPIDSISLSGLLADSYPMIQAVPLNYTLVIGQAAIT